MEKGEHRFTAGSRILAIVRKVASRSSFQVRDILENVENEHKAAVQLSCRQALRVLRKFGYLKKRPANRPNWDDRICQWTSPEAHESLHRQLDDPKGPTIRPWPAGGSATVAQSGAPYGDDPGLLGSKTPSPADISIDEYQGSLDQRKSKGGPKELYGTKGLDDSVRHEKNGNDLLNTGEGHAT